MLLSIRGMQYPAQEFQLFLKAHRIGSDMNWVGNGNDNAVPRFFWFLIGQSVHHQQYQSRFEVRAFIFDHIEIFAQSLAYTSDSLSLINQKVEIEASLTST